MIIGSELGIGYDPGQHAAYAASWIQILEDQPFEIFRAAADGEKIQTYLLQGLQQQQSVSREELQVDKSAIIKEYDCLVDGPAARQWLEKERPSLVAARAQVEIGGRGALGDHVFSLLEGTTGRMSFLVPGRQARRWMCVASRGRRADAEKIASRLRMNPEFAGKVYEMIVPGTTVIITDQPIVRSRRNAAILER